LGAGVSSAAWPAELELEPELELELELLMVKEAASPPAAVLTLVVAPLGGGTGPAVSLAGPVAAATTPSENAPGSERRGG